MAERITGTVRWFSVSMGLGAVGADGSDKEYAVHYDQIMVDGFRWLEKEERVSFEPQERGHKGRPTALALERSHLVRASVRFSDHGPAVLTRRVVGEREAWVADLTANAAGTVALLGADGKPVGAHVDVPGNFRAYHVGSEGFLCARLHYSRKIDRERGGLVVLNRFKTLLHKVAPGSTVERVDPQWFLANVRPSGDVRVLSLAWRNQSKSGSPTQSYLILRVEHQFKLDLERAEGEAGYIEGVVAREPHVRDGENLAQSIRELLHVKQSSATAWKSQQSAGE